jgi:hypothetical protein
MSTVQEILEQHRSLAEREALASFVASTLKQHFLTRDGADPARKLTTDLHGPVRESAIREFAEEMNATAETCRLQLTTLRGTHVR